jgi:hypothetical protein
VFQEKGYHLIYYDQYMKRQIKRHFSFDIDKGFVFI